MGSLRFLTAGESHGRGLVATVEGMVAGLSLSEDFIARDLKRRQGGYGRGGRMKIEKDRAEILSGVIQGFTTGSPIALLIWNKDWENWRETMSITPTEKKPEPVTRLRPGHADLAGALKYGFDDLRPIIERSSARETTARVAAGAVAKRFLEEFHIEVHSHTVGIGGQHTCSVDPKALGSVECDGCGQRYTCFTDRHERMDCSVFWDHVEASPVRCADPEASKRMVAAIDEAKEAGDTVGGTFEVIVTGLPIGLGSHVQWDRRLDGRVAQAVMSIHAVKGVELGDGFTQAERKGSKAHDLFDTSGKAGKKWQRTSNLAGGLEAGMTNGQPLVVRAAVKPISTLAKPLPSVDLCTGKPVKAHYERSDVCIVPAAGVIGEAMVALVLADAMLEKFGGDNLAETRSNCERYLSSGLLGG